MQSHALVIQKWIKIISNDYSLQCAASLRCRVIGRLRDRLGF